MDTTRSDSLSHFILCGILALALAGVYVSKTRFQNAELEVGRFVVPPAQISHLSFGYSSTMADLLWIRVVQDFGYCEARDSSKNKYSYENARVLARDPNVVCQKNWVFQMLDRVTDLDPHFRVAFQAGGTMLSILVNDPAGAQAIFAKGLRQFPNDWNMNFRAGYHQLFEMKNEAKAAQYFLKASQTGAPAWLAELAARLYTKQGKAEIGKVILADFEKNNPEMAQSARFKELSGTIDHALSSARAPAATPAPNTK